MYRVSNFVRHFARALVAGAVIATIWVNLSPESYYDAIETSLFPLHLPEWLMPDTTRATLSSLVTDLLMALFFFLLGKELWEARHLERGALHGTRGELAVVATAGAILGGILVWLGVSALVETAQEAAFGTGWAVPIGGDVVLSYVAGRHVFGRNSPALHLLLLIGIASDITGLLAASLGDPERDYRLVWLLLPLAASVGVWFFFGRHDLGGSERERQEARHLTPYIVAGALSWIGVAASGLPGALGLLPVIPAIPHTRRAFGLFAAAEELLHDPLNKLAHLAVRPLVGVLFLFGLTRGGIDFAAFAPTTVTTLAAFWLGRPVGLLIAVAVAVRLFRLPLPAGLRLGDLGRLAWLTGLGFTVPAVALDTTLPGGAMSEAARLGLALSLLVAPLCILARKR